jgi:hypothetical protein
MVSFRWRRSSRTSVRWVCFLSLMALAVGSEIPSSEKSLYCLSESRLLPRPSFLPRSSSSHAPCLIPSHFPRSFPITLSRFLLRLPSSIRFSVCRMHGRSWRASLARVSAEAVGKLSYTTRLVGPWRKTSSRQAGLSGPALTCCLLAASSHGTALLRRLGHPLLEQLLLLAAGFRIRILLRRS